MTKKENKLILLGVISSAYSIKGEVIIKSFTNPINNIVKLPVIDKNYNKYKLKLIRTRSNGHLICDVEGYISRSEAEKICKTELYCFREDLSEIKNEDEFYIEDLIGLQVISHEKLGIGKIVNVVNYGAGDILEIKFTCKEATELFPFIKSIFPEITKDYILFIAPDIIDLKSNN